MVQPMRKTPPAPPAAQAMSHAPQEAALIGAVLADATLLDEPQIAALRSSHFDAAWHDRVWSAICDLHAAGRPATYLDVLDSMPNADEIAGDLTAATVDAYLLDAFSNADPRALFVAWAADIARRAAEYDRRALFLSAAQRGLSNDEVRRRLDEIEGYVTTDRAAGPVTFTIPELLSRVIPPAKWAVENLIPEGLTVLAGKPKIGKSWMVLGIGMAVACGGVALGKIDVPQGDVLYLALEDTDRRLQSRVCDMLDRPGSDFSRFHFATEWKRLSDGGAQDIDDWLTAHPAARLVIVDTYARVQDARKKDADIYANDYAQARILKQVADRHSVAVILVHHFNKGGADDFIDNVSGSAGVTGAADAVLGLFHGRGENQAIIRGAGRDLAELNSAMTFDPDLHMWTLEGDADEYKKSAGRKEILACLRESIGPMGPSDIADAIGKPSVAIRMLLSRMVRDGDISVIGRGQYVAAPAKNTAENAAKNTPIRAENAPENAAAGGAARMDISYARRVKQKQEAGMSYVAACEAVTQENIQRHAPPADQQGELT